EMKTGEGKTLVAVMPVYLNALAGKGVHVVTVNDYLASRDAQWMGRVYSRLGLECGCVTKEVSLQNRRQEYSKDITYIENSELGFDYLRDNLVKSMAERSLIYRPLNYAIVDEIDSILIDEARTPLIISEANAEATEKYVYYAKIASGLIPCTTKKKVSKGLLHEIMNDQKRVNTQEEDGDYYIDEKTKTAAISGMGIEKLEKILGVENLYRDLGYEEIHHIENALRAQAVYLRDTDYIVKDGEVLIVDEHTGRTMQGRRFSEGLHQAIEAKENVRIQRESKTLATITYQNFFKQYKKLAGMTGTALTEGKKKKKIYELSVLEAPTNKPTIRVDRHDKVYFNQQAKWKFVKQYIKFAHEIGQPILIGTSSITTSEQVSHILEKENIVHYVLNAKFHEQEAHIVSQAGKFGNVVVATNMAGRGTDIKLETGLNDRLADNYANWMKKTAIENGKLSHGIAKIENGTGVQVKIFSQPEFEMTMDGWKRQWKISDEMVRQAEKSWVSHEGLKFKVRFNGQKKQNTDWFAELTVYPVEGSVATIIAKDIHYGLFILGTEKHESRRIDNQLRGRAGRQGDPGVSVFFVALDDLIMRKMGGERIQNMAAMLLGKKDMEDLELTQKQFSSAIVRAQKQMEGRHFGTRKHLFDYDSVINKQRQTVYRKRDEILESEHDEILRQKFVERLRGDILGNIGGIVQKQVLEAQSLEQPINEFLTIMNKEFALSLNDTQVQNFAALSYHDLAPQLAEFITKQLSEKLASVDPEQLYKVFKDVYLYHIDTLWIKHLDEMEELRDKVGLVGYAQLDPLVIYKSEAFTKFQNLLYRLKYDVTAYIASLDFSLAQAQAATVSLSQDNDASLLKMLANVSKQVKSVVPQHMTPEQIFADKKAVFESSEGVEVFEVGDNDVAVGTPEVIDTNTNHKPRPNDPCPCGSGKKYKKCHGAE
ncbi:MAG: preprotein translocase subunit SecA, partial [candidate division SR1 bacterium]|nr:preprotein translocase subunit SecA [candidate division SR1 bacterium]